MQFEIKFEEKKGRSVHSLYLFGLPGMLLLKKIEFFLQECQIL